MLRWRAEAWPVLTALMDAEDRLISRSEGPAVLVQASCDQLDAAVRHTQSWVDGHRCPDTKFGLYVAELIASSRHRGRASTSGSGVSEPSDPSLPAPSEMIGG